MPSIYSKIDATFFIDPNPGCGDISYICDSFNNFRGEPGQPLCELGFIPAQCTDTLLGIHQKSLQEGILIAEQEIDKIKVTISGVFKVSVRSEFLQQIIEDNLWYVMGIEFNGEPNNVSSGLESRELVHSSGYREKGWVISVKSSKTKSGLGK